MNRQHVPQNYTVVQLRNILRSKGLPTKGRKAELIRTAQQHGLLNMAARSRAQSARQQTSSDANGVSATSSSPAPAPSSNGTESDRKKALNMEKEEREKLVLWRQPLTTLQYSTIELFILLRGLGVKLWRRKKTVGWVLLLLISCAIAYRVEGPHQSMIYELEKKLLWWGYWVGLGILSSVGLGTGLHTFLLYLGPHIASVTLAAYECKSVDFPEPPYPNQVLCPEEEGEGVNMWTIMSKVRMEAIMWGAGTAIGELPPYFMARAARLSGADPEDDDFEELEELIHEKKDHPEELGLVERAKLYVHSLVQRVGFFGILVCASIPNPLFDLAGITCGHFLIPFWTFFGATIIGKAIIKVHLQKLSVIFAFSVHHVERAIQFIGSIPYVGPPLQTPFRNWLANQRKNLHHKPGTAPAGSEGSIGLSWVFEKILLVMVVYFVLSIVNSMAQSYHKRLCRARHHMEKAGVANYTQVVNRDNKTNRD